VKTLRLLAFGWYFQFKTISRPLFEGVGQVMLRLRFFENQGRRHATLERS
jgi:hypothetical protein